MVNVMPYWATKSRTTSRFPDLADADDGDSVPICSSELLDAPGVAVAEASIRRVEPQHQRRPAVHDRAQVDRVAGGRVDHLEGENILRDALEPRASVTLLREALGAEEECGHLGPGGGITGAEPGPRRRIPQ